MSSRRWAAIALGAAAVLALWLGMEWLSARGEILALSGDRIVVAELGASAADDVTVRTVSLGFVRAPLAGAWVFGYTFELRSSSPTGTAMRVAVPLPSELFWNASFRVEDPSGS